MSPHHFVVLPPHLPVVLLTVLAGGGMQLEEGRGAALTVYTTGLHLVAGLVLRVEVGMS